MRWMALFVVCLLAFAAPGLWAQQNETTQNAPAPNVPAAPAPQSANGNRGSLPNLLRNVTPGEGTSAGTGSVATEGKSPVQNPTTPQTTAPQSSQQSGPAPVIPAQGTAPSTASYTLRVRTNFVLVPVTVKDKSGQLVAGLTWHDFQVYENGVRQRITFFTEDPFPLSVAFVIDQSLPSDTMRKVNDALSALQGAFAPYDEVSVFTYATHVTEATGFTGAQSQRLTATLQRVKSPGDYMEIPSNTGPLAEGPILNGRMVDPNTTPMHNGNFIGIIPKENHALNDAIFQAAKALSQRGRGRRKLIYVISDGKNQGSKLSYKEVVRYLLTNQIAVDGTLVGDSALPVLGFLDRYHLPWQMTDNLLPKYAAATGGLLDAEISTNAIERSFARVTDQVRNQYTLGYDSHISVLDSRFRHIEVRVLRPNLTVISKQGYYPTATPNR